MDDLSGKFDSGAWEFTPEVVAQFDEHVGVHVPNYQLIQELVVHLSDWFAPSGSCVVDVGAATGTTIKMIVERHPKRDLNFVLYDVERSMLDAADAKLSLVDGNFSFSARDLSSEDAAHEEADLTICLFTLQFVSSHQRVALLRKMREAARDHTGTLILAEKLEMNTGLWQEIANEATWDHKASHGVPAEDIRLKAKALRGVLQPMTAWELEMNLDEAGWGSKLNVYRWYNWGVWLARNDSVPAWH